MTNNDIQNAYMGVSAVTKICLGEDVVWPTTPPVPVYSAMPLTFEIISGGTIGWTCEYTGATTPVSKTIQYRKNNGVWTNMASYPGASLSVNAGDRVEFRGNNDKYSEGTFGDNKSHFTTSGVKMNVEGNILSMLNSTGYQDMSALTSANTYAFKELFKNCGIVSSENLVLQATTLVKSCYSGLFSGCSSMTTGPILPAKRMREYCYSSMFDGCRSLTTAPELPATGLSRYCFLYMFRGCASLTSAPSLPVKSLAESCYEGMFTDCTSIMSAPELLATTKVTSCYKEMFMGCSSLNYVKCLLKTPGSATDGYTRMWLRGVSSTGTFVKHPDATSWATGTAGENGIPNRWTVIDADI